MIGDIGIDGSMKLMSETKFEQARTEIVERVSTAELVASWQSDFGVDVARLFEGIDELALVRDVETGLLSFYPAIEGDAAFYQAMRTFDWYHPPHKEEFATAAQYHQHGERVLDVGAGEAGFARYVPDAAYRGLETDPQAAQAATLRGLNVLDWDMQTYLASEAFQAAELVTAFQVLEHASDPAGFVRDMAAMACAGGRVAIGVPDVRSYVADLPDFMLNAPPHHLTWWTEEALGAVMAQAGLRVCGVHRFAVEPWERQLWWMAKLARLGKRAQTSRFGAALRARKVASFLGSWGLQFWPIPAAARGSTLLMIGEKAD